MSIKLVILKTGENIITEIKGFYDNDNKLVCYVLENPCEITLNGSYDLNSSEPKCSISLNKWPILSKNTTIEVQPGSIITFSDPVDSVKELYTTQVLGN